MKSWTDRLDQGKAVIKPTPRTMSDVIEGQLMLVPTARQVDDAIRAIPAGQSLSVRALRNVMAEKNGAEVSCPVYTGYHLRTVAEAATEAMDHGAPIDNVTPFWRVLDAKTPTTGRLTIGAGFVAERRHREGLAP